MGAQITLENEAASVSIAYQGAEMQRFRWKGRDLLWKADPAIWSWQAPNLFPIVGALPDDRLEHDGQDYRLPPHGFLRHTICQPTEIASTRCTFRLDDLPATRAVFPFSFRLDIGYALEADRLIVTYLLSNPGMTPLPASLGAHPAFAWPLAPEFPAEAHRIRFEQEETAPIRRLDGKLLSPVPRPTPVEGRDLALSPDLFDADAVIFDQLASHSLVYGVPGGPGVRVSWDRFRHLGLWSRRGGDFLCIEPWQGYATPADFHGAFDQKPGLAHLAPGESRRWRLEIQPLDRFPEESAA